MVKKELVCLNCIGLSLELEDNSIESTHGVTPWENYLAPWGNFAEKWGKIQI